MALGRASAKSTINQIQLEPRISSAFCKCCTRVVLKNSNALVARQKFYWP